MKVQNRCQPECYRWRLMFTCLRHSKN